MDECGRAEGEGPNRPSNHILHLKVILGLYSKGSSSCPHKSVLLWSLYVEIIYLFFEEVRLMCLHVCAEGLIWTETGRTF